jgi:hypothetical protein
MNEVIPALETVRNMPLEYLLVLLAFAAIGLAAFTVHAVTRSTKAKGR